MCVLGISKFIKSEIEIWSNEEFEYSKFSTLLPYEPVYVQVSSVTHTGNFSHPFALYLNDYD